MSNIVGEENLCFFFIFEIFLFYPRLHDPESESETYRDVGNSDCRHVVDL